MNTLLKRIISLVLCLVMVVGYVPVNAFADETGEAVSTEAPEVTPDAPAVVTDEESEPEIPEAPKPEAPKPEAPKPEAPKPEAPKPEAPKPKAPKPEAPKPEAPKPEAPKPEAPKPEAPKPEAPKPEAPKPEAPKPEAPKTEPEEPEAPKTEQEEPPVTEEIVPSVIAVTGITLDQTALEVAVGELPMTLTATVQPEDATDKTVTWTSSEPGVASVEDGVLTFGYMGEAVITATAGEFSASCTVTVGEGEIETYDGAIYVLAASDFQHPSGHTSSADMIKTLSDAVKTAGYSDFSSFLYAGDYCISHDSKTDTEAGIKALMGAIGGKFDSITSANTILVQGNHDYKSSMLTASGENDTDNYGIFVINEDDYMDCNTTESTIQATGEALDAYLDEKLEEKYDKPIFVISHLPLHYGPRTARNGDGKYAHYLFDPLNEAGAAGLNIIFLYGHNHAYGYDNYLGGYAVYLPEGDQINIAVSGKTDSFTAETLNFTYMNAGFTGYHCDQGWQTVNPERLSMTVFAITDNKVEIRRINQDGEINLKVTGQKNGQYDYLTPSSLVANTDFYISPQTVKLNKDFDGDETVIPEGYALARVEVVNQGTTKYFLNNALDTENLVVEAVYTKENAADVRVPLALQTAENADGYTVSGFDMAVAGKQYVTVTYNGFTGSYAIEVFKTHFENAAGTVAVDFTSLGITSVAINEEAKEVEGYSAYVTYDITPVGYTQGDEATVTIALDTSLFDVTRPVKVLDQGNVIATPAIENGKITFTTNHFSEYDAVQTDDTGADVDSTKWKEVVPASGGTTTYTYSRVNSITPNGEYVIVADNSEYALDYTITENFWGNTTVSMTSDTVDISNNGSSMTSSSALTLWKFSGSSGSITISNGDYTLGYASSMGIGSNRSAYVQSGNSNNFIIKRRSSNTGYALYYNNGWTTSGKKTAQYVRLYQLTNSESVGGTGATYAQAVGPTTYQVALGTSAADALAFVKNGMTVYTANTNNATTGTLVADNSNVLTWTMASNYNPNTAGDYAVTIKYNNVELATVTVKVLARIAQSVTLNKNEGTVERDSGAVTETGAYLTVTWDDDTTERVPVTVGMLSGSYNVNKNGSYTGLTISYGGETFENFTLNVVNKSGLDDYPVYPNPGSIDLKKSAAGVDFQNTGIARVELSTSGLPSERGVDVVVVLDMSSSMRACIAHGTRDCSQSGCKNNYRVDVLRRSLLKMIEQFNAVNTTTGKAPDVEMAIIDFNGYGPEHANLIDNTITEWNHTDNAKVYTGVSTPTLITETTLSANNFVSAESLANYTASNFTSDKTKSGTNYDDALKRAYYLLDAKAKANTESREQFVIFMSDGAPFGWNGINENDDSNMQSVINYYWWNQYLAGNYETLADMNTAAQNHSTYKTSINTQYEFLNNTVGGVNYHRWAEAIKGNPVADFTVYDDDKVSDGVAATKSDLFTVKGLGATIYSIGFSLADDTRSYNGYREGPTVATMEKALKTIASEANGEDLYEGCDDEDELTNTFKAIAGDIAFAATNARYVDQMGDSFNLQMNPTIKTNASGSTGTIPTNTDITITTRPVYTKDQVGNTVDGHTVTTDDIGKPYGNGTTVETVKFTVTNGVTTATTSVGGYKLPDGTEVVANSTNILVGNVIYGKNFFYNNNNAAVNVKLANGSTYSLPGETFYWNIGTINETLYTISYTVYLEGSLDGAAPPSNSYDTNNFAILYYTNHVGNEVSKSVASPSLAWLGANVSYAFYLVNDEGTPVHADGTVAQNFLLSHKITQPVVYKSELLLNNAPVTLSAQALAVLPSGYELFDNTATYTVQVGSGDGQGSNVSHWQITGNSALPATTYVVGFDGANDYSKEQYVSDTSYDYTHTTVYFAVKWVIGAVQDTVVIDYGLPVDINVMYNDMFGNAGTLHAVGPRDTKPTNHGTTLATGFNTTSVNGTYGTAALNNGKIRYTLNDMQIKGAEKLAYAVDYQGEANKGFYYGDLTVIPATTVYYEDEYVTLKTYTRPDTTTTNYTSVDGWPTDSVAASGVQAEDRPGSFNLDIIDANNIYGFDQAYEKMSTHSMGNSAMIHVDAKQYGTAEFSFWGTGFDVISTTSNTTGTMVVQIYDSSNKLVKSSAVDTYYGYTYGLYNVTFQKIDGVWTLSNVGAAANPDDEGVEVKTKHEITSGTPNADGTITGYMYTWKPVTNDPNALYQVPVIQHSGLPYGNYKVKITALYYETFDATTVPGYDLYLDAIRIYNPAGTGDEAVSQKTNADGTVTDVKISDIYAQDGEAWPSYYELRNLILSNANATFDALNGADEEVEGIIFIDGNEALTDGNSVTGSAITDYKNFGPNNELYLAKDQAVAFNMNLGKTTDHPGHVPVVRIGLKTVGGETAVAEMWNAVVSNGTVTRYNAISDELKTATDMYYDITVLNGRTVVIKNSGEAGSILSITNIKLTYKPTTTSTAGINEANTVTEPDIPTGRMFTISRSAANAALMTLAEPQVEIPETPAPEETVPETTVPEETVPEETKPAKPDSSDLKESVEAAKALKEKDYTKDSYKAVKSALKAAEKVLKDKKASQAKIDAALEALNDAIAALEAKPDNSELKAAVDAAKKLKEKDYSQESFKQLKNALTAAEKVLNDKKASQAEIDEALANLNAAVDGLKTVDVKPIPPKPGASGDNVKNGFKVLESIMNVFINLLKGNNR